MPDELQSSLANSESSSKKKTISELAEFHLKNQNHITTDDEIRNAEVEVTGITPDLEGNLSEVNSTTVIPALPGETTTEKSEKEDEKDKPHPNAYDVLG